MDSNIRRKMNQTVFMALDRIRWAGFTASLRNHEFFRQTGCHRFIVQGRGARVNRMAFKSDQTAFLDVEYHGDEEEAKGLPCGPVLLSPNLPLQRIEKILDLPRRQS
jgi:hypothetical protein